MSLALRPGLSFCVVSGQALFLDLPQDRYFCLKQGEDEAFRAWARGSLSPDNSNLHGLIQADILTEGLQEQPPSKSWQPPRRRLEPGIFSLRSTIRALRRRHQVSRSLARNGLAHTLALIPTSAIVGWSSTEAELFRAGRIANAHEAADVLIGAHDKCLSRAISLTIELRRSGLDAFAVLSVALRPFQAHSWVQLGDQLVNDDLETVRKFQPILVI